MSAEFVCGATVWQTPGAASQSNCFNKEMYRLNFMRKSVVRFRQMTYIGKCWKTPVLSVFLARIVLKDQIYSMNVRKNNQLGKHGFE